MFVGSHLGINQTRTAEEKVGRTEGGPSNNHTRKKKGERKRISASSHQMEGRAPFRMVHDYDNSLRTPKTRTTRQEAKAKRLQQEFDPSETEVMQEQFGTLNLPCYCIVRVIGMRLPADELKRLQTHSEGKDTSRKRGIHKYLRCIVFFKGDLEDTCVFTNNRERKCKMYLQFFENPSDSFNRPPDKKLCQQRGWSTANNGWGERRGIIFSCARSALVDAVQNCELNLFDAPRGDNTVLVPNVLQGGYPTEEEWNTAFEEKSGLQGDEIPTYEWGRLQNLKHPPQREAYRLRPASNLVTNAGLHLFRVEGAGGKWLPFYKNSVLHPELERNRVPYIKELQRSTLLSYNADKVRFDLLKSGDPPKLKQVPEPIRRFRSMTRAQEAKLNRDAPFFPIFARCDRGNGILDIKQGLMRFRESNFSYPSVAFDEGFQQLLTWPEETNIRNAQIRNQEMFQELPLFRSLRARPRFRDAGAKWGQDAERVLQRNQYNSEIGALIEQLRDLRVPYGPIDDSVGVS